MRYIKVLCCMTMLAELFIAATSGACPPELPDSSGAFCVTLNGEQCCITCPNGPVYVELCDAPDGGVITYISCSPLPENICEITG